MAADLSLITVQALDVLFVLGEHGSDQARDQFDLIYSRLVKQIEQAGGEFADNGVQLPDGQEIEISGQLQQSGGRSAVGPG